MKKSLKYIKIEGKLKSRGEYKTASAEYRPYEAVTIEDSEGQEIHFHTLTISKRMDECMALNHHMTFYILRCRIKDSMTGILYALNCDGKKIFYPDTAISALKGFGLGVRNRYHFISYPAFALFAIIISGGLVAIALRFALGVPLEASVILGLGGMGVYTYLPLLMQDKGAAIDEMHFILAADGFDSSVNNNAKY